MICYEYLKKGGEHIKIKDAIVKRFRQICKEQNISFTKLARISGVAPSTVYSMLDPARKDISVITVKKLCDGLEISLVEFFDSEIFWNLSPEID